jgi:hypothetical protein
MRVKLAIVMLVLLGAAIGCSSGGKDAAKCETVPQGNLDAIAEGAITPPLTLSGGQAVAVDNAFRQPNKDVYPDQPHYIVAAKVVDGEHAGEVGAWSMPSISADPGGPILALDEVAKAVTQWGADAAPGSPAGDYVTRVAGYSETADAVKCVESPAP